MLIFLSGPDTFRSRQQLKKMIVKFKADRDPGGYNVVVLDCEREEPAKIMEQLLTLPFLSDKRLIILENLLTATKKTELQEEVLARIKSQNLPQTNNLIFWESDAKPKTKAAKELWEILSKEKFSQNFEALCGAKLITWINQEIKDKNSNIEPVAINYLANNCAGDIWKLNSLIEQLSAYKTSPRFPSLDKEGRTASDAAGEVDEQQKITLADVQLFLDEKGDDNIFTLVDAIVGKQPKQVYQMIREQYKKGEDAQFILAMIMRQFKILLQLRDLFEKEDKISSDELAKRLNLHPFVVKKSLPLVKRYTLAELKKIYQELLQIDIKTKTGQGRPDLLLDLFVGKNSI